MAVSNSGTQIAGLLTQSVTGFSLHMRVKKNGTTMCHTEGSGETRIFHWL